MYKRTLFRILALLIVISMLLVSCKTATDEPVVQPPEPEPDKPAATEVKPDEPDEPDVMACPPGTVADPMGVPAGAWSEQYELSEYETLGDCEMSFSSREEFHQDLWTHGFMEGDLPPLEDRLPAEPLVIQPYEEIGEYGGRLRMVSIGVEAGNSEYLSVRHALLVRFLDDHKTIVPYVAKSYAYNDDFTELTFELREGHKWSDGEPFTVDDVLFWYNDIILNEELYPSTKSYWVFGGEPATMEKVDDLTFKWKFSVPAPGFLTFLARKHIQPWQPQHYFEKLHIDYNPDANDIAEAEGYVDWVEHFYKFHGDWQNSYHVYGIPKLESHILVEETTEYKIHAANPYFFIVDTAGNQLPYLDEITQSYAPDKELIELKIIAGEVDFKSQSIGITSLPVLQENTENGNYAIQMPPGSASGRMYTFNCTHQDPVLREIFADPRFNQAMSLALDRDEINKVLCYDLCEPQQGGPVHPLVSFAKPEWYEMYVEFDPTAANALLDDMGLTERDADGFRLRPDGEPLVIINAYTQQAGDSTLHELTKDFWEDVGIRVELKEVSTVNYRTLTSTNEHDMGSFYSGGTAEAPLYSNPQPFMPPFGDPALGAMCGGPWYDWWASDGASGEEPPDDVKDLFDMTADWQVSLQGSDEYASLGQDLTEIHLEHLWVIGTISQSPQPTIVSNRLGNVPQYKIQAYDYFRTIPYRTYQWYVKE